MVYQVYGCVQLGYYILGINQGINPHGFFWEETLIVSFLFKKIPNLAKLFFLHWKDICNVSEERTLKRFSIIRFVDNTAYAGFNNKHKEALGHCLEKLCNSLASFIFPSKKEKQNLTDIPIQCSLKKTSSAARPFLPSQQSQTKRSHALNFFREESL